MDEKDNEIKEKLMEVHAKSASKFNSISIFNSNCLQVDPDFLKIFSHISH